VAADPYDGGVPRPVESVLADLERLLDELARAAGPDALDGAGAGSVSRGPVAVSRLVEVSARLRVAGTRMDAVRWSVLPRIEAAGRWARSGARTFAVWLARAEDVQTATAKREVRTARALRDHLPATLTKALAGHISQDKVRALVEVATTSTERTQALGASAVDLTTLEPAPHEPDPHEPPADSTDTGGSDGEADGGVPGVDGPAAEDGAVPVVGSPTSAATPRRRTVNTWMCPRRWAGITCPGS
jgi:hypothetical protein